jgi:hypothetical protein
MQPEESLKVARTDCLPRKPELEIKVRVPFPSARVLGAMGDLPSNRIVYYFYLLKLNNNATKFIFQDIDKL